MKRNGIYKTLLIMIISACILYSSFAFADSQCAYTPYAKWLKQYFINLEKNNTSIFYAELVTGSSELYLIIEFGSNFGVLVEKVDCSIVNLGKMTYLPGKKKYVIADTHGGVYSYSRMDNFLDAILKEKFIFVPVEEIKNIPLYNSVMLTETGDDHVK